MITPLKLALDGAFLGLAGRSLAGLACRCRRPARSSAAICINRRSINSSHDSLRSLSRQFYSAVPQTLQRTVFTATWPSTGVQYRPGHLFAVLAQELFRLVGAIVSAWFRTSIPARAAGGPRRRGARPRAASSRSRPSTGRTRR